MNFRIPAAGLVALFAGITASCGLFQIQVPHGSPVGRSVLGPDYVATLIATLEPYTPSLHHDPKNERRRLSVYLYPLSGGDSGRMISLDRYLATADTTTALGTHILGDDGKRLWVYSDGLVGVETPTGRLVEEDDLRRANPSLGDLWTESARNIAFSTRLRITTPDRSQAWEVDPGTLKAEPAGLRHSGGSPALDPRAASYFASAGGSRVPAVPASYRSAAFLRADPKEKPMALSNPAGHLIAYTVEPTGTLAIARVDAEGKQLWTVDTGIDRRQLWQVLPGAASTVFTGPRPRVPGKVSEPLLVVIHHESGAVSRTTLWQ
jgi:hypothetical protein